VAEARDLLEQARAAEAERARVAAEAAAAMAAVKAVAEAAEAAKRQQLEERLAALALEVQQVQAELGSGSGTPHPDAEETQCVVCFDAPKDHAIVPCGHVCVCEACAEQLTKTRTPTCPVCREPIRETMKVFCHSLC
jgi:E3 ubiquitin-protein ligase MUL1